MPTPADRPAAVRSLGVITGLVKEANCVRRASGNDTLLMIHAVAGQANVARDTARAMIDRGASGLLSFGIAGGLDPSLGAGVVVIADAIHEPGGKSWPANERWVEALTQFDGAFDSGVILGSDTPVMTARDKRKLFQHTGALAVDMESHAVAAVAHEAEVPFAAIRAIGDPAERSIPRAALPGLSPSGRTRALPVIAGLLRRPGDFVGVWRLANETNTALSALRAVADAGAIDALD
ncbi:MAG: hypothetical protein OXC54_03610 [Rhodospirillaceae bacterium]|nr:hypothetical protein [Rhodospirillaceae bacterium]